MQFEFYVPGLKIKQAKFLLDIIVAFIEALGLEMGGGFSLKAEDDGEKESESVS